MRLDVVIINPCSFSLCVIMHQTNGMMGIGLYIYPRLSFRLVGCFCRSVLSPSFTSSACLHADSTNDKHEDLFLVFIVSFSVCTSCTWLACIHGTRWRLLTASITFLASNLLHWTLWIFVKSEPFRLSGEACCCFCCLFVCSEFTYKPEDNY